MNVQKLWTLKGTTHNRYIHYTDIETETDIQTDRQTDDQIDNQIYLQTDIQFLGHRPSANGRKIIFMFSKKN